MDIIKRTPSHAYIWVLNKVYYTGEVCRPRGLEVIEVQDLTFEVTEPTVGPIVTYDQKRNSVISDYTRKEMELYKSGTVIADDWQKASKAWGAIANPDGTINSAYGWLALVNKSCCNARFSDMSLTPWEWAVHSLTSDKDSRQAFVRFSLPEHQWIGNKDQVCTMHMNFLIRKNELNAMVVMRSQDVVRGLVYDMPFFIYLQHKMVEDLIHRYPYLCVGRYRHISHSMHMYTKDNDTVQSMIGRSELHGLQATARRAAGVAAP